MNRKGKRVSRRTRARHSAEPNVCGARLLNRFGARRHARIGRWLRRPSKGRRAAIMYLLTEVPAHE